MPSFRRLRGRSPTTQCFLRLLEPAQFELLALDGTGFLGTGLDLFSRDPHAGQQVTGQSTHAVGPYEDIAAGGLGLAGGIVEFVLRIQHVQQAARAQQELVVVSLRTPTPISPVTSTRGPKPARALLSSCSRTERFSLMLIRLRWLCRTPYTVSFTVICAVLFPRAGVSRLHAASVPPTRKQHAATIIAPHFLHIVMSFIPSHKSF